MRVPAFAFTCRTCSGETVIDFHRIHFDHTYSCTECRKPFRISKRQGLSISKQLEDYANSLPDEELTIH